MNYFIYCRKSSEEESRQVQSLETQERMLLDYANKYNLQIVDVIKESKSAKTDGNRPLFSQMLQRIMDGEANGILVTHVDRLSRNGIESGLIVKLFESSLLKELRTISRIYNTLQDLLYIDFDFVFASHYSRNLSIRTKEGITTKLKRGEFPGYTPIGYVNRDKRIYPDPRRATFIRKAFTLYSSGCYTLRQVTKVLYDEGFRTRTGLKVPKSTIHKILNNPIYYGAIKHNGEIYKGNHKPIVSKVLFDKVKDVLNGTNRSKRQIHNFLYRDYLTCNNCGCKLTASIKKGRFIYYYCTNGKRKCEEHKKYIPEKEMFKLVLKIMDRVTPSKEMFDMALDIYTEDLKKSYSEKDNTRELIKKQLETVNKKLDRLLNAYLEGTVEKDIYEEKQKSLKNEKAELELSLSQVKKNTLLTTLELLTEFKNQSCSLYEMFKNGDNQVRSDLLKSVLWNLQIENQEIASIQYKKPHAYMEKVAKSADLRTWLRDRDSNPN